MNTFKSIGIMTAIVGLPGICFGFLNEKMKLPTIKISELLETENKFILLAKEDDKEWEIAWEAYKLNNFGKKVDEWNIKDWKILSKAPEEFKNICHQKLNKKINNRENLLYKEMTSYCTRPKKLFEAFEKDGIKLLSKEGNDDAWKRKINDYEDYLDLLPPTVYITNENIHKKMSNGCWALAEIETTHIDYQTATNIAKFLCLE